MVGGSIPSVPTKIIKNMQIEISKTNYKQLLSLIDKACSVIKAQNPKPKEYNIARQLYLVKKQIEKKNGQG